MISSVAEWQCGREQNSRMAIVRMNFLSSLIVLIVLLNLVISPSFLKAEAEHQDNLAAKPISSFFGKRAEGWHWYEDSSAENSLAELQKKLIPLPTEVIKTQRKELETKLHAAIVEPTHQNIIAYILAQRALMDQSQRFSEAWKRVVMTTPSLDETLIHPVDQNARHVYYDKHHKELQARIKKFAQEYGLFFFFRKNCPYCHGFAPIVKRFSEKYSWSVLAVSLDGGTLSEFPEARQDNGIAKRLQVSHVPALIALHPKTGKLIPLSYGMVSESEIEARVELLTQLFQGARK